MKTKRTTNVTALKFKFLPPTNTKGGRYKVTQTNTNESTIISAEFGSKTPIEGIESILNTHPEIENFSLLVDNTQSDSYYFVVNSSNFSFPDLLQQFKDL